MATKPKINGHNYLHSRLDKHWAERLTCPSSLGGSRRGARVAGSDAAIRIDTWDESAAVRHRRK